MGPRQNSEGMRSRYDLIRRIAGVQAPVSVRSPDHRNQPFSSHLLGLHGRTTRSKKWSACSRPQTHLLSVERSDTCKRARGRAHLEFTFPGTSPPWSRDHFVAGSVVSRGCLAMKFGRFLISRAVPYPLTDLSVDTQSGMMFTANSGSIPGSLEGW
jgi:hypothetical protein